MPAFTVILFTAAAAAAGPNAAFEISANGRRMQPLASALPSPTSTNSPSYGPTVSYAVSYATTIASKYASVSPSVSVSNHVIASPSASFTYYVSASASASVTVTVTATATATATSQGQQQQQQQSNIFALITDNQWTAILVPSIGFSVFLICCVYWQHTRIKQLENKLRPANTRYQVPYHSAMRHIITANEPTNYV